MTNFAIFLLASSKGIIVYNEETLVATCFVTFLVVTGPSIYSAIENTLIDNCQQIQKKYDTMIEDEAILYKKVDLMTNWLKFGFIGNMLGVSITMANLQYIEDQLDKTFMNGSLNQRLVNKVGNRPGLID